jgi:nucleoporin NUP42
MWILSSFGAAKYEPNVLSGYDVSPEELRWKSVQALKANRAQDYVGLGAVLPPFLR